MQVNPSPELPPANQCIYCGETKGLLTREHIIPRMLGGNMTLPKASCDRCAKITRRIEGYAGRRIFQDVRLKHGFRIKQKPTHLPMFEEFGPSPEEGSVTLVPTKHVPGMLFLFNPEPPGMLTGKETGAPFGYELFFRSISDGVNDTNEVRKQLGLPGKLVRQMEVNYLGRLLAKIALGIGVAACGVDGFISTISSVILKEEGDWHYWVGGTTADMLEFDFTQSLGLPLHRTVAFGTQIAGVWYLIVQLQLLTYLQTPVYTAVVGQLNEAGLHKLNAGQ